MRSNLVPATDGRQENYNKLCELSPGLSKNAEKLFRMRD